MEQIKEKKFIFITGGVLSSIGKGIGAASIGMLMRQRGLRVGFIKMDPYLNVDPGTMNPLEHGEVYVLDDGSETDLDLGHYFRFVEGADFTRNNSFTTGRVYDSVIRQERAGGYLGETVQVIPHITNEIKKLTYLGSADVDICIVEVGGTVGDIESLPFLEAIRQMRIEQGVHNVLFVHMALVPYIVAAGELKTKPTQHSVKELRCIGIQPDLILCRCDRKLSQDVREKLGLFSNVPGSQIFSAVDVESIYEVPLHFYQEGVDQKIVEMLRIEVPMPDLSSWKKMVDTVIHSKNSVKIAVVGKYVDWKDSYKSLFEALIHGGAANNVRIEVEYIDSEKISKQGAQAFLARFSAILIPGGFGERGIEGKILAIEYARVNRIPLFGICLGMQLIVVEYARNVCGITQANSQEFQPEGKENVISLLEEQKKTLKKGGTMRLGAYSCAILQKFNGKSTFAYSAYEQENVQERHRHRFEVSPFFRNQWETAGLIVSGTHSQDKMIELVEIIEIPEHPWFLGCQFHPEFLSRPLKPHPLFVSFIKAALKYQSALQQ